MGDPSDLDCRDGVDGLMTNGLLTEDFPRSFVPQAS
jgi:hypothetical protein